MFDNTDAIKTSDNTVVVTTESKRSRKAKAPEASGDFVLVKQLKAKKATKTEANPTKPKAEKVEKEPRISAVSMIRALLAGDPTMSVDAIMEELEKCGIPKPRSTAETIKSDWVQTYKSLVAVGAIKNPVEV